MVSPRAPIGKRYRPSGVGGLYGDMVVRKRGGLYYEDDYDYLNEAVDERRERRLMTEYSSDEDDDFSYLRTNFQHEQQSVLDRQRTEKDLVARAMSALALAEETNSPDVQMDEDEWEAWTRHLAREEAKLKRKQEALAAARTRTMAPASISTPNLASAPKYPTKDHSSSSSYLPYPGLGSSSRPESRSTSSLRNYMDTPPLTPPTLATASNSSRKKASSKPYPADKTFYPRDYAASTVSSSSRHRTERERDERRSERERGERGERKTRRRRDDSD